MNRSDNIRFLQELSYRRRRIAWRAGGVVAAIALSSCIGTGVAFADELVVDSSDQQVQAVLVQDDQGASDALLVVDESTSDSSSEAAVSDGANEQLDGAGADQVDTVSDSDESSTEVNEETSDAKTVTTATASETSSADNGNLAEDSAVKDSNGETIEAFDLRHAKEDTENTLTSDWTYSEEDAKSTITGGTSYVTPVKLQNPWGSCWAFASTAASETSLLTELDKADDGELNGSIDYSTAAAWAKLDEADDGILNGSIDYGSVPVRMGILAEYATDLSERHLAWFSFNDVSLDSVYPDQAGEGKYLVSGTKDATSVFDAGGWPWLSLTEYASGSGPVPEWMAPYISDETLYLVPTLELNDAKTNLVYITVDSLEEAEEYIKSNWTDEAVQKFNEEHNTHLTTASATIQRSSSGTWSLPDAEAYTVVAELSNSNVLDQNLKQQGLSAEEITLMKQELLSGHAISIVYKADQSRPGQVLTGNTYMNTATWGQYTYDVVSISHSVTIVGYDDNYAASNFTHNVYQTDANGNLIPDGNGGYLIDEETTALTTPAGNGAWIVKNSWGSVDAENPVDNNNWGIDGSGYFYLSYYDKTISHMESYEFDVSEEAQERLGYLAYQHDLANVSNYNAITSASECKMCNVFDGPEQGEGGISIRDLGFVTGAAGDTTTIEVYVMDDDADVVETLKAGNAVASATQYFVNSGYHRIHLDSSVIVMPNQKFAVVQTTQRSDGSYEYVIMDFYNEDFVKAYNAITEPLGVSSFSYYLQTVVNKGESLIMSDGVWQDWLDVSAEIDKASITYETNSVLTDVYSAFYKQYVAATDADLKAKYLQVLENCKNFAVTSVNAYDNWCIKAYADATNIDIQIVESDGVDQISENTKTLNDTCAGIVKSLYEYGSVPANVREAAEGIVKSAVDAGEGLIAELSAVKVSAGDVSASDRSLVALAVQSLGSDGSSSEVLQYFDVEFLLKSAKTGEVLAAIASTDAPVSFAIQLDDELLSLLEGKSARLVRIHDGASTFIDCAIKNGVLRFNSGLFSTYALAVVSEPAPDPEPAPEPEPAPAPESEAQDQLQDLIESQVQSQTASYSEATASPKTGDDSAAAVGLAGVLAALSSAALMRLRRRSA